MSEEPDEIQMRILSRYGTRESATIAGRNRKETRPIAKSDRQAISTLSRKERQLNLKVTTEFYDRVAALARNARMSMPNFIEHVVNAYARGAD